MRDCVRKGTQMTKLNKRKRRRARANKSSNGATKVGTRSQLAITKLSARSLEARNKATTAALRLLGVIQALCHLRENRSRRHQSRGAEGPRTWLSCRTQRRNRRRRGKLDRGSLGLALAL